MNFRDQNNERVFSEVLMSESWATQQEVTFLKNLGRHREGHEIIPMRRTLLENYVKAARKRG